MVYRLVVQEKVIEFNREVSPVRIDGVEYILDGFGNSGTGYNEYLIDQRVKGWCNRGRDGYYIDYSENYLRIIHFVYTEKDGHIYSDVAWTCNIDLKNLKYLTIAPGYKYDESIDGDYLKSQLKEIGSDLQFISPHIKSAQKK